MFDLEKSVSTWRKQMLAAEIETLALEELEAHLREEIQQQVRSGESGQRAFEIATSEIGRPSNLKTEFEKVRVPVNWRIIAVVWFAGCLSSLGTVSSTFGSNSPLEDRQAFLFNSLAWFIYAAGVLGSFLLFRGLKWGVQAVRTMALLILIVCVAQCLPGYHAPLGWQIWCGAWALFSAVSIRLLHPSNKLPTTV